MHQEIIQIILGIKIAGLRRERKVSLKELSQKTGMSLSYINEIEKGKKFPKVEKMLSLSQALGVPYEELISTRLDGKYSPLATVLQSPMIKKFPFHIFGTSAREILQLMVGHPEEMGVFARMVSELGRNYDMRMEQFFHTALRCYQLINNNYFEDLEKAALAFRKKMGMKPDSLITHEDLKAALIQQTGYKVIEKTPDDLPETLKNQRYFFLPQKKELWLNHCLSAAQRSFVYGRELGYHLLGVKERPLTSPALESDTFDHVFENFRVSYFASSTLLPEARLKKDLKRIFGMTHWEDAAEAILDLTTTYGVTPETLFYRLSELVPHFFETDLVHFLKLSREGDGLVKLEKQLNMSRVHIPNGIGLNENFCARWLSVSLMDDLEKKGGNAPIINAQRSKFLIYGTEFFCMTVAYRGTLRPNFLATVTLGFPVNEALKQTIKYWSDDKIPYRELGQTCERCPLEAGHCKERVVEARLFREHQARNQQQEALERLAAET